MAQLCKIYYPIYIILSDLNYIIFVIEVIKETRYDPKVDIYSFGVSFSEVLTCMKPYSNTKSKDFTKSIFKLHEALVNGERPGPLPREPEIVMTLISKCWQTEPTMRPSAFEVSQELMKIINQRYNHFSFIIIQY